MASEEKHKGQNIVQCSLCQEPVSFFCRRCGVNLCDHCLPIHMRVKSKNGHDVVDYAIKDDNNACFCEFHPKNDCSAYCETCNVPICMLCVSIKHKSHAMSELSDKIEELIKVITLENERLQSFKHELEKISDHTTKLLSSIPSIYKLKKHEVTERGEEWHKEIDKTVKKLHQELDGMQKEHEALLQQQEAEYKEMIEKLDVISRKAANLQKTHDVKEMQTFIPLIAKQKTLTEFTQYSFPTFYECKFDENYLQTYFGYVEKMSEMNTPLFKKKFRDNQLLQKGILEIPTVTDVIDTGFPADDEKNESRLYDMAVTDDNKVWVGGNSEEIKLFDLQGNLYRTVKITWKGYYLCMYKNLVVYSGYNAMNMISEKDSMMFTTGSWIPRGVTSTASGDLLVCLSKDDQYKVVRYSGTGTVLQEIQYDSQCQPLYTSANYITENVNGDIIVTDWKRKAVIVVDRLGLFRFSYLGKDRDFFPFSVANDSFGHVIIADDIGAKIHMLDRDGKFMRYIIPKGGLKRPRAVCILSNGDMIVGECTTGIAKRIKYFEE